MTGGWFSLAHKYQHMHTHKLEENTLKSQTSRPKKFENTVEWVKVEWQMRNKKKRKHISKASGETCCSLLLSLLLSGSNEIWGLLQSLFKHFSPLSLFICRDKCRILVLRRNKHSESKLDLKRNSFRRLYCGRRGDVECTPVISCLHLNAEEWEDWAVVTGNKNKTKSKLLPKGVVRIIVCTILFSDVMSLCLRLSL